MVLLLLLHQLTDGLIDGVILHEETQFQNFVMIPIMLKHCTNLYLPFKFYGAQHMQTQTAE